MTPRRASRVLSPTLLVVLFVAATVWGDTSPQTLPFAQDWTNTGLITVNDNWTGVPGIEGRLGDFDAGTPTNVDPRTIVNEPNTNVDVIANQTTPSITNGGVAEFHATTQPAPDGTNPVVALQGSGPADYPHLLVTLNTTGRSAIVVAYNVRDIDATADNAVQQVNLQFRVGASGDFTNVTTGANPYIADATTGPSLATLVTSVNATLPAVADNQPVVQLRIMTSNAGGNDEWVGIDDIQVTGSLLGTPTATMKAWSPCFQVAGQCAEGSPDGFTTTSFTLTADFTSGSAIDLVEWDFDGNGTVDATTDVPDAPAGTASIGFVYGVAGSFQPQARSVDISAVASPWDKFDIGGTPINLDVIVQPPVTATMQFWTPCFRPGASCAEGTPDGFISTTFTLTADYATPPDRTAVQVEWDFDGDGTIDQTLPVAGPSPVSTTHLYGVIGAFQPLVRFTTNLGDVSPWDKLDIAGTPVNLDVEAEPIAIHLIQGSGSASPLVSQVVTTSGVVTGRKSNGFFIQTPDGLDDGNPNTSEGVFVFTSVLPPAVAAIGNVVVVRGTVTEFIPGADLNSPPMTELSFATVSQVSTGSPLPAPVAITVADTNPAGSIEQLERREGMRVSVASMTVVHATGGSVTEATATSASTGVFYGTLPPIARPFREAGIEAPDPIPSPPCCIPRFDGNPERLRVDSDAQPGASAIEVTTGATVTGLVGPLDYGFRTYTILPDAATPPLASGNVSAVPVAAPAPDEFTVASFNLERFFDDVNDPGIGEPVLTEAAFNNRLNKASLAIRNMLRTPDILGVQEAEHIAGLTRLADKINNDAMAAGDPNPAYTAHLVEGIDVGGIDVGFLVKSSRVNVLAVTQEGRDATYIDPDTGDPAPLNDRPPLVLEAEVTAPAGPAAPVTVIVNHLRSFIAIDDPADGARVRAKRRAQAEFLAALIQSRQAADPTEPIVSVGDYNAFQFNDGYVDSIGTIKGTPAASDSVVLASPDMVDPNLVDLVDFAPASQKYSYAFDGNAQVLDHVIVNNAAASLLTAFQYARLDSDFPESFRNDPNRPERLSDHDAAVAYFTFGGVTASVGDQTVTEGDSGTVAATFTVTLDRASALPVTVNYATQDGTATSPADYQAATGTVTFAPGDTEETVTVNVVGDLLDENDETFLVNLSAPVHATLADSQAVGTILDNDPLPSLTIGDHPVFVEQDTGQLIYGFPVQLSAPSGRTVTVNFEHFDITATHFEDYFLPAGTLTFEPSDTMESIPVGINGDTLDELAEDFFVTLNGAANATIANGQTVGTIYDDEIPGADFNFDGATDLLWRHQGSGQNAAWLMNGVNRVSGTFTTPSTVADTDWRVVGTNDFNQDEQTDILWRHAVSGQIAIWMMDGTTRTNGIFTTPSALADTNWEIRATGDFNSDGKPDILWRHAVSGQIVVWRMDGTVMTSGTFTTPSTLADPNWQIVGSGDFNRDGKADILWRHAVSGQIAVWYMDGTTRISGTFTTPSALSDTNWEIMGTGDFNLDTRTDILWRHAVSGQIAVWYMDGVTLKSGTFTNPSALPDVNWQIVGPR